MTNNPVYKIRPMKRDDLDQAIILSSSEGWNQTEKDWKLLLDNPMNICLVAEFQDYVAGTATALNHSNEVAWIGMVLVKKDLRGSGIGKMLLSGIIERLDHIKSVKLDATPAGQPLYKSLGFIDEYIIYRMVNMSFDNSTDMDPGNETEAADIKSFYEIMDLDKRIFGTDRSYLLQNLFKNSPEKTFVIRDNSRLDGYIFGRDGLRFNYLGPVSARSHVSAIKLISKALKSIHNKPVAIDVLNDKEELIKWLESVGFVKQRHFVRMYLGNNPFPGDIENQYLISGPEYG